MCNKFRKANALIKGKGGGVLVIFYLQCKLMISNIEQFNFLRKVFGMLRLRTWDGIIKVKGQISRKFCLRKQK